MDELIQQKLLGMGYDAEKRQPGSSTDVHTISEGHLEGLVLFSGRVVARDNIFHAFQDNYLLVNNVRTENRVSLYISPLEKRFENDGLCFKDIQPTDRRYIEVVSSNSFNLVIEDVRKRNLAIFEFFAKGEMLYVPKKS